MGDKLNLLLNKLKPLGNTAVAFSGGVDSTLLLRCAAEALGRENVLAVTAISAVIPHSEAMEAAFFCRELGVRQITFQFDILGVKGARENPPDRCYLCKRALFLKMLDIAVSSGFSGVIEGSNKDDEGDYRPGLLALSELGIKSPLRSAGLTKGEIRALSRELSLPTVSKPSMACLATRIPYGEAITEEKLSMIERAEDFLFGMGFSQARVRLHGEKNYVARIELAPDELNRLLVKENRDRIQAYLLELGFSYVSADLAGYRTGSLNEVL